MRLKRNVDLTENRDFSGRSINLSNFIKVIYNQGKKYPWSVRENKESSGKTNYLFLTGTKEIRKMKQNYLTMSEDNYCECCGYHSQRRWFFKYGLCRNCINSYNESVEREKVWFLK